MIVNEKSGVNYPFIHQVARGSYATAATLPVGAVAIVAEDGTVQTSSIASSTSKYKVAKMTADGLVYSPEFTYASITSKVGKYFEQAQEQVTIVGYDNVTAAGSISTVAAGDTFKLGIELLNTQGVYNNSAIIQDCAYTAQTATAADVATGIFAAALSKFKAPRLAADTLMFGRTSDGTVAAFDGDSTVTKFTKGSKLVSVYVKAAAANTTLTASTCSISAAAVVNIPATTGRTFTFTANACGTDVGGHVIYIGNESYYVEDTGGAGSTENGTAIAAAINASSKLATASSDTGVVTITYKPDYYGLPPVAAYNTTDTGSYTFLAVTIATGNACPTKYVVATGASTGASFTLDYPWQGETGYAVDGTTAASNSGVVSTITQWGLKIVGLPETTKFNPKTDMYRKVRFNVVFKNLTKNTATTTILNAQLAKEGTGTWQEVSVVENNGGFKRGKIHVSAYPPTIYAQEVENYVKSNNYSPASQKYDSIYFTFNSGYGPVPTTGHTISQPITISIYSLSSLAYDELETVLAISPAS